MGRLEVTVRINPATSFFKNPPIDESEVRVTWMDSDGIDYTAEGYITKLEVVERGK